MKPPASCQMSMNGDEYTLTPEELALCRHRGPFQFQVCRYTPTQKMKWHTETLKADLKGETAAAIIAEARALIDDPRDSITAVYIWSVPEQQHVITIKPPEE